MPIQEYTHAGEDLGRITNSGPGGAQTTARLRSEMASGLQFLEKSQPIQHRWTDSSELIESRGLRQLQEFDLSERGTSGSEEDEDVDLEDAVAAADNVRLTTFCGDWTSLDRHHKHCQYTYLEHDRHFRLPTAQVVCRCVT